MKNKHLTTPLLFFCINFSIAQVGINTTNPDAQLDIRSSNQVTPANNDGILIPKIDAFPLTNPTIAQHSMLVYLTTVSGGNQPGFYYWNNTTTSWTGITSTGDHDWYEVGTTTAPNAISDNMFHMGNVAIGKNTTNYPLEIETTNFNKGFLNTFSSSTTNGINKYGFQNELTLSSNDNSYGIGTNIIGTGNGIHYGIQNSLSGSGTGIHYGTYNALSGTGTGTQYGNYTTITNTAANTQYGSYTTISGNGFGGHTGNYNLLSGGSGGVQTGTYNEITNTAGSSHYGSVSNLSGSGAATKYGFYADINSLAGGTHYGVYSQVLKAGATNFAGYFLGNVGIGTTAANTYTLPPSRGTANQIMQTNGAGVVTWQNPSTVLGTTAWLTTGNAGLNGGNTVVAGTNFIGTTDNQNIDFRTNNQYRGRFSNLGEFFVGTLNTVLTGDLMIGVGNATFPWATNGYSSFDGSAIYGQITAGTTIFAGVQGEYNGTNASGTGVRGLSINTTAGTGFNSPNTGVSGNATTSGTYKYGVYGSGGTTTRTGGVMGYDYGLAIGALGYYSFSAVDYSVYGFGQAHTNGVGTGRNSNNPLEKNTNIGLGIYGGVMGGWVRGLKYGFHTKGETYSLYVDGNAYTNKPLVYLMDTGNTTKTVSYMTTSIKPEVTINGKTMLENGKVFVAFDRNFIQIISNIDDIIITASPQGKSNGIYIDNITKDGFWIYENNNGISNVKISWIAITKIKGEENPKVPNDLLASDFDRKMSNVMFNENNKVDIPQSLWWDGSQIRWDRPINDKVDIATEKLARPKETKEQKQ